tara:strand:+ start:5035 stop:5556 length:522 start_codon:yes stop_codon:yes gene_type:complete
MPLNIYIKDSNSTVKCMKIKKNSTIEELYEETKKLLETPLQSLGNVMLEFPKIKKKKHMFYKWKYDDTLIIFDEDNLRVIYIQRLNLYRLSFKIICIYKTNNNNFEVLNPWTKTSRIMYNRIDEKKIIAIHCCTPANRIEHLIPIDKLEVPLCTDVADFKKMQMLYNITMATK